MGEEYSKGPDRLDLWCLAAIVAWGLALQAPHLAHPTIRNWDEGMHQAAARGTYETFFEPHLYREHLRPADPSQWWVSTVWLHKPTAPFWFAAAVMKVVGVTPMALRLGGLLGQLGAAAGLFLLARRATGRRWALLGALGFLALPFGWRLTQGFFFGDATDATLVGWVTLSMLLLVRTVERQSWRWALAAGAAVGVAYLCKSALALVPLGTASVLFGLGALRLLRGPRARDVAAMLGAAVAVAAPWNVYSALTWPVEYAAAAGHTFAHVLEPGRHQVGPWTRPWDAIFNEVLATEVAPLPHVGVLLAGVWLVVRAVRRRELPLVAAAVWLWATWVIHSLMVVKVPAQVWNALPAAFIALGALGADLRRAPALAGATLAALASPWIAPALPFLSRWRTELPGWFEQTRTTAGLFEGALITAAGALLGAGVARLAVIAAGRLRADLPRWTRLALAAPAVLLLAGWIGYRVPAAQQEQVERLYPQMLEGYTVDVGKAIDRAVPEHAALFLDLDLEPPGVSAVHALMFWSGRGAYPGLGDVALARVRGYRPYLISPAAEPYLPVPGVPAHAWLRAYELDRPAPPPPVPEGVHPLNVPAGPMTVLGWASAPIDGRSDRYAFYVRPDGVPAPLPVTFVLRDGTAQTQVIGPRASLRDSRRLQVPWFVAPAVGPPSREVATLRFGPGAAVSVADPSFR